MPNLETKPRFVPARRDQLELVPRDLESLIPSDHEARGIWNFVEKVDLSAFYAPIKAVEGEAGRPATDPKVLLALELYSLSKGIGSAREVVRQTECHDAYRWIRGGVPLNHHTLSDFRIEHREALDKLLTQSIAVLMNVGAIALERVAQDGTKVRASAGRSSFRRGKTLERCLIEAQEQLAWVKREAERGEQPVTAREQASRERAARERAERVDEALRQLPEIEKRRDKQKTKGKKKLGEARASTTDPDARVMKMGNGGYAPGFNFQFATDSKEGCIVGVTCTNSPADSHQLSPMLADILRRCGKLPTDYLVDAGYTSAENIDAAEVGRIVVYGPVLTGNRKTDIDPFAPRLGDSPAMVDFRLRMGSAEGKTAYRDRAQLAELTNAVVKERFGVRSLSVRGLEKATCIALWAALTFNVMKMVSQGLLL